MAADLNQTTGVFWNWLQRRKQQNRSAGGNRWHVSLYFRDKGTRDNLVI
jgi:hypothetical protein